MPQASGQQVLYLTLPTSEWVNLPDDILNEIMKRTDDADLPSFAAVCKPWRSMYINHFCDLPRNIPLGVPILLLGARKSDSNSYGFVRMNGELASNENEIFLSEIANKWVCGSSWGWLVLAAGTYGKDMSLLNPLTRHVIQLPSILDAFTMRLNCFGEPEQDNPPPVGYCYVHKAILSKNPTTSERDCIILAIVGWRRRLTYCRIGDEKWTIVEHDLPAHSEVIYHHQQQKFYATDARGVLMSFDITDGNSNSTKIIALGIYEQICHRYLIIASGRLLLISRTGSYTFKLYLLHKLNSSFVQKPISTLSVSTEVEIEHKWVEIDSIGDHLLFVGNNASFSLPARSTQMYNGSENCIYFTDHYHDYPYIGVFNIGKKYTRLYSGDVQDKLLPSFWMIPSPW